MINVEKGYFRCPVCRASVSNSRILHSMSREKSEALDIVVLECPDCMEKVEESYDAYFSLMLTLKEFKGC